MQTDKSRVRYRPLGASLLPDRQTKSPVQTTGSITITRQTDQESGTDHWEHHYYQTDRPRVRYRPLRASLSPDRHTQSPVQTTGSFTITRQTYPESGTDHCELHYHQTDIPRVGYKPLGASLSPDRHTKSPVQTTESPTTRQIQSSIQTTECSTTRQTRNSIQTTGSFTTNRQSNRESGIEH